MSALRLVTGDQPDRTPPFEHLGEDKAAAGQSRARREANEFDLLAYDFLRTCGAEIIHERRKIRTVTVGAASAAPPVDRLTDQRSHGTV